MLSRCLLRRLSRAVRCRRFRACRRGRRSTRVCLGYRSRIRPRRRRGSRGDSASATTGADGARRAGSAPGPSRAQCGRRARSAPGPSRAHSGRGADSAFGTTGADCARGAAVSRRVRRRLPKLTRHRSARLGRAGTTTGTNCLCSLAIRRCGHGGGRCQAWGRGRRIGARARTQEIPATGDSRDRHHTHRRKQRTSRRAPFLPALIILHQSGFNLRGACAGALFDGTFGRELGRVREHLATYPFARPARIGRGGAPVEVVDVHIRDLRLAHFGSASSSLSLLLA
jgi:hypothetical protein